MAITTYDTLQDEVAEYLSRSEFASSGASAARTEAAIALVESDLNSRPGFCLRFMRSRVTNTLSQGASFLSVPSDLKELRNLWLDSTSPKTQVQQVTHERLTEMETGESPARPLYFAIIGDEFRFAPAADASYTVQADYFARIQATGPTSKPDNQKPLSDSNTTNWLITNAPLVYFWGTLAMLGTLIDIGTVETGQDQAVQRSWGTLYERQIAQLIAADRRGQVTGGPLRMRTKSSTP